ncbi:unnamed protein product [Lepeophtheirus salmonis]|uniref:(salmon louse) hypothetical protein n=1 Tax=Lepeophtheirus salmonis TaxID=72036 RepID=A0A7R8CT16_LEPSM|nr:unnamed protein product [Lepeophtheirus salmonis]CAF2869529.1 unnamed protein product [Lepeophtheirus salmonis]
MGGGLKVFEPEGNVFGQQFLFPLDSLPAPSAKDSPPSLSSHTHSSTPRASTRPGTTPVGLPSYQKPQTPRKWWRQGALVFDGPGLLVVEDEHPFRVGPLVPLGEYKAILSAWNPISGWMHSKTANIAVVKDIKPIVIEDFSILNDRNETKAFNIQLGGITETVCVMIDFGDGTKNTFYGDFNTCIEEYPFIKPEEVDPLDTGTNNFNVTHIYSTRNLFECNNNFFYDVPEYFRSSGFSLLSCASIFCEEPTPTFFEWTAHLMSEIEGIEARERSFVILNESISSWNLSTINVPKRFLKPGLYKFTVKFGIKLQDDFKKYHNVFKEASTLIRVKATPLQPVLIQGSPKEVKRGWDQIVSLNPLDF